MHLYLESYMNNYKLISHHLCPYVQRAAIVLHENNIEYHRADIDLGNKPNWFLKMSPLGRVPVLEVGASVVFESQIIAEYLNEITNGTLHPIDSLQKARHRSWIEFGSETLNAIGAFYNAKNAISFEQKKLTLAAKFKRIDLEIKGPYFDGNKFHLIDGVWGTVFRYLDVFDKIDDFGIVDGLEKTIAWRELVANRPSIIAAAPTDYNDRLMIFLENKQSFISKIIKKSKLPMSK